MKTPEELFAALGNRGEYAALPHVTLDEVKMIYAEGHAASCTAFSRHWSPMKADYAVVRTAGTAFLARMAEAEWLCGTPQHRATSPSEISQTGLGGSPDSPPSSKAGE